MTNPTVFDEHGSVVRWRAESKVGRTKTQAVRRRLESGDGRKRRRKMTSSGQNVVVVAAGALSDTGKGRNSAEKLKRKQTNGEVDSPPSVKTEELAGVECRRECEGALPE